MSKSKVGVIGLGSMGGGVARSLLRAGFATHVCDARPEVVQAFVERGRDRLRDARLSSARPAMSLSCWS